MIIFPEVLLDPLALHCPVWLLLAPSPCVVHILLMSGVARQRQKRFLTIRLLSDIPWTVFGYACAVPSRYLDV